VAEIIGAWLATILCSASSYEGVPGNSEFVASALLKCSRRFYEGWENRKGVHIEKLRLVPQVLFYQAVFIVWFGVDLISRLHLLSPYSSHHM
jgi:hypothetical protein